MAGECQGPLLGLAGAAVRRTGRAVSVVDARGTLRGRALGPLPADTAPSPTPREVGPVATQEQLARCWEVLHGRPSGALAAKGATVPPIDFNQAHGPGSTPAYDPAADPGLQRAIASGREAQALGYGYDQPGGNICPACAMSAKDGNARNGRCPHRPSPAEAAERRRWQAKTAAVRLVQELESGMLGTGSVPVLDAFEAAQRDSYGPRPPVVDRVWLVG
jgi:hypothetical protein